MKIEGGGGEGGGEDNLSLAINHWHHRVTTLVNHPKLASFSQPLPNSGNHPKLALQASANRSQIPAMCDEHPSVQ